MKKLKFYYTIFGLMSLSILLVTCQKEKDPCELISCLNGGVCIDGTCDCPPGTFGVSCEKTPVQNRLESGQITPLELFSEGTPLDSIYGKIYAGGMIFYLDVDGEFTSFNGLVASVDDIDFGQGAKWGCYPTDILDLTNVIATGSGGCPYDVLGAKIGEGKANTDLLLAGCQESGIAARLCDDYQVSSYDDWFLPSKGELNLIYTNLYLNNLGNINADFYWSSSEESWVGAWAQKVNENGPCLNISKGSSLPVKAVRMF